MSFDGVTEWQIALHRVVVSPSGTKPHEVARFFELRDDSLDSSLGNADTIRDSAEHDVGLRRDAQKNVGMVGKERPWRNGSRRATAA